MTRRRPVGRCRTSADGHLSQITPRRTVPSPAPCESFLYSVKAPAPPAQAAGGAGARRPRRTARLAPLSSPGPSVPARDGRGAIGDRNYASQAGPCAVTRFTPRPSPRKCPKLGAGRGRTICALPQVSPKCGLTTNSPETTRPISAGSGFSPRWRTTSQVRPHHRPDLRAFRHRAVTMAVIMPTLRHRRDACRGRAG
jgi:hypothetical protein